MICIKGARLVITLVLLFLCQFVKADTQHHFYFSPVCIEAQKHIAALRLNKAQQMLSAEKKLHPDNVAIPFLEKLEENTEVKVDKLINDVLNGPVVKEPGLT